MDKISVNPFVCINNYSFMDYVKMILGTPLVLVRIFLVCICLILVQLSSQMSYLWLLLSRPKNYYEVKPYYLSVPVIFFRMVFFILGFYKIEIVDESESWKHTKRKAGINILVPHTSIYDLLAICNLRHVTCVARHQVKDIWFLSRLAKLGNPILVKREDKDSRKSVLNAIKDRVKNEEVLILPEGTCGNRQLVLQFKPGAFVPGLSVQPYAILYDCDDLLFKDIDHVSWVREGPPLLVSLWITASKLWTTFKLVKLPVYEPNEEERRNPSLYALNVQKFVTQKLNLRRAFYSFDDLLYLELCRSESIPRSPACIRFLRFCTKLSTVEKSTTTSNKDFDTCSDYSQRSDPDVMGAVYDIVDRILCKWKDRINSRINCKEDIVQIFEIQEAEFLSTSSYVDFVNTVQDIDGLSVKYLFIIAFLCDNRHRNLWQRIEVSVNILLEDNETKRGLTMEQFRNFLWCLLGLEKGVFQEDLFCNTVVDYGFIRKNLVTLFRRAVSENAECLLGK